MDKINDRFNELSINPILSKQFSQNHSSKHGNFGSLLKNDDNKEPQEDISSPLDSVQQSLQNQAFLNRALLNFIA